MIDGGDCARIGRALAVGDWREYRRVEGSLTSALKAEIERRKEMARHGGAPSIERPQQRGATEGQSGTKAGRSMDSGPREGSGGQDLDDWSTWGNKADAPDDDDEDTEPARPARAEGVMPPVIPVVPAMGAARHPMTTRRTTNEREPEAEK
jgi:hypothetical protein